LARHESSSRRLLKGELVVSASDFGYPFYSAETIAGSGTSSGNNGILRYENSKWNVYHLMANGDEFTQRGYDVRTDGDTIAWYTKGSNFEEFEVWQRISGEYVTDRSLARELTRIKPIFDDILIKRASKQ